MRAAAAAGKAEAARVTATPIPKASRRASGLSGRPVTSTARVLRRKPMISAASPIPSPSPRPLPMSAELRALAQEEAERLALGHAGGAQQPDLARPLGQRHGQRVGDQERADRERDEPEQERDPGEALLRATELALGVGHRLDDERLAHLAIQRRRPRPRGGPRRRRGRRA